MSFRRWIELESDPGLFTLLVYDFGVQGVEVEEVYDLSKEMEKHVYGFIFLFKWTEERKTRRKAVVLEENFVKDEKIENDMFFAQQIIPNSCASHALLSVLLNVPDVSLGHTLKQLRDSCKGFDSETKGLAIGNFWNIAVAHNNHGRPDLRFAADRSKNVTAGRSMEAFHYASYIPYNGHLYELDGLKPHPIDHGPWMENESWTDKARRVIQDRILFATGGELSHDIRYNLLAVVPEQRKVYKEKMEILRHNKKVLIEIFKNLADKESFVVDKPLNYVIGQSDPVHPFHKQPISRSKRNRKKRNNGNSKKSVSFNDESPVSPGSASCVSTVTGTESVHHPFSDSDCDDDIDNYRIKSIIRGKPPVIYVKGQIEKEEEDNVEKEKEESSKQDDEQEKPEIPDVKEEISTSVEPTDYPVQEEAKDDLKRKSDENSEQFDNKKVKINESDKDIQPDVESVTLSKQENTNVTDKEEQCGAQIDNMPTKTKLPTTKSIETSANLSSADNTSSSETVNETQVVEQQRITIDSLKPQEGVDVFINVDDLLDQKKIEKLSLDSLLVNQHLITLPHLQKCIQELDELYNTFSNSYKEELEKIERYKIDDCRRRHNYEPFIATFLSMLAEQGHLTTLLEQQNNQNAALKQKKELLKKKKKTLKRK